MKVLIIRAKASSLVNAIYVCLVVAIFCGILIFLSHFNSSIYNHFENRSLVLELHKQDLSRILINYNPDDFHKGSYVDENRVTEFFSTNWGGYNKLSVQTISGNDTIKKSMLLGAILTSNKPSLALYLSDTGNNLKYSGNTEIIGGIQTPRKEIERYYLNNTSSAFVHKGDKHNSSKILPKLSLSKINDVGNELNHIDFEDVRKLGVFVNGFNEPTMIIHADEDVSIEDIVIKGNIIIESKHKVEVQTSSTLEDIIIRANEIRIVEGFEGVLQLESDFKINIEKGVTLKFPSGISSKYSGDSLNIRVGKRSKVQGFIKLQAEGLTTDNKVLLAIEENAQIFGDIYCNGFLDLQGDVLGTVYTDYFLFNKNGVKVSNLLNDAYINGDSLAFQLPRISLLQHMNNYNYESLKEL